MINDFSIFKDKAVGIELERIIHVYIESCHQYLNDASESPGINIHEIRRSLKKMRAFIRLIKPVYKSEEFKQLNDILGKINKILAEVRESRVNIQIFGKILPKLEKKLMNGTLELVHKYLQNECTQKESNIHKLNEILDEVKSQLREFIQIINAVDMQKISFQEIVEGIVSVYKSGKKLLKDSVKTEETEIVHTWRKYVKHLQFELSFIKNYLSDYYLDQIDKLQQISNFLGEEHDLVVLSNHIENHLQNELTAQEVYQIINIINRRRNKLRKKAFKLGRTVFDTNTSYFRKEIESFLVNSS